MSTRHNCVFQFTLTVDACYGHSSPIHSLGQNLVFGSNKTTTIAKDPEAIAAAEKKAKVPTKQSSNVTGNYMLIAHTHMLTAWQPLSSLT